MMNRIKQSGITIIELMISITIGLILIASVSTVYVAHAVNSLKTLQMSKLNQELSQLMSLMVKDIRRAG